MKLRIQTEAFIKALGRAGAGLQDVAAESLNESADEIVSTYKKKLARNQTIRTKFTLNAPRAYHSKPTRSSGKPRPLKNMNSIAAVRKMKGGKEHYLADLELGVSRSGTSDTRGRVPVPLPAARTGKNKNKPISGQHRLTKQKTQTLRVRGTPIGTRSDPWQGNPRQRFAIIYDYFRGRRTGGITGDPKKPFFFFDLRRDLGIFKFFGNRMKKIRTLSKSRTRTRRSPNFQKAVKSVPQSKIQKIFIRKAEMALAKKK